MKTIKFEKLSIKNFLSIGNEPVEIDFSTGLNLITGENLDNIGSRNGIGKSSILSSIFWIIFGETIQDLKKNKIRNNKTKEECSGTLNLIVNGENYTIKRILEPSSVKIIKNSEDITLSTIDKNNEYIQDLLGVNKEVFKNSVILTADNTIPFLAQKKIDKRKFIEGVLNLNIFSEMLLKVRKDFNDKKKESDIEISLFENENKNLDRLEKQKLINSETKDKKINLFREKIKENEENIHFLRQKNENVESDISELIEENKKYQKFLSDTKKNGDLEKLQTNFAEILAEKVKLQSSIQFKKTELVKFEKSSGNCPTCNRPFCEDIEKIKENITELKVEIDNLNKKYTEISEKEKIYQDKIRILKTKITEFENNIDKNNVKLDKLNLISDEINKISNKNLEILDKIDELLEEKDTTDELIKDCLEKIEKHKQNIKIKHQELSILENAKLVVSEDGVKTVIIKKILDFLNKRLNYYLSNLDAPCVITFDETFDCEIKNGKTEIDYWNMSGGERKRTDAAIIFTFQDLLDIQTGVKFNLSIYDEWADSALDEKGLSKFLEILRKRVLEDNQAIYIIGHSPNLTKFDIDNTIFLQKKNGVTLLKK